MTYITNRDGTILLHVVDGTYFDAARWTRAQGLTAKDVLFHAIRPRTLIRVWGFTGNGNRPAYK